MGSEWIWPVPGITGISSYYGPRDGGFHHGVDIAGNGFSDKPIVASKGGTVTVSINGCPHNYGKTDYLWDTCGGGYGNYVMIDHEDNTKSVYAHLSRATAKSGESVKQGQIIGYGGSTGMSTGPHIHFEVQYNGQTTNPMQYFN